MKLSQKAIQKAREKEMRTRDGHYANNLETEAERILWERQEAAMERIKSNPDLLRVIKRMKDR